MADDRYQEKLDAHSFTARVDPLRDAAHEVVMAWEAEDNQEKNDLSERIWRAIGTLAAVLVSQKRGEPLDPVPEVEVTYDRSPVPVDALERHPAARRSGAKNVSAPEYQNAFISEARRSMGQPTKQDAEALLGERVTLVFNVDWRDATGVLTEVKETATTTYLYLDNYRERTYPLNSIQEIRRG
jgi:hypothetical protein